jgi:thioredoxin-like negative regulator of GroEL
MQTRSSGGYRTITQDELIDSRLGRKTGKIILHFFSEDSEQAEYLDQQMTQLASLFRGCTFLRVEGRYAPLIARKLNVKQFPSIVAVRNGEAVDCIRDFKSREDGFVQEWFFKTGFVGFL